MSIEETLEAYAPFVEKMLNPKYDSMGRAVGLAGEAGEVLEVFKKVRYHDKPYNRLKVADELGDVFFHLVAILNDNDLTLEEIIRVNQAKLNTRYDQGIGAYRPKNEAAENEAMDKALNDQPLPKGAFTSVVDLHAYYESLRRG